MKIILLNLIMQLLLLNLIFADDFSLLSPCSFFVKNSSHNKIYLNFLYSNINNSNLRYGLPLSISLNEFLFRKNQNIVYRYENGDKDIYVFLEKFLKYSTALDECLIILNENLFLDDGNVNPKYKKIIKIINEQSKEIGIRKLIFCNGYLFRRGFDDSVPAPIDYGDIVSFSHSHPLRPNLGVDFQTCDSFPSDKDLSSHGESPKISNVLTKYGVFWYETGNKLLLEKSPSCGKTIASVIAGLSNCDFSSRIGLFEKLGGKNFVFKPFSDFKEIKIKNYNNLFRELCLAGFLEKDISFELREAILKFASFLNVKIERILSEVKAVRGYETQFSIYIKTNYLPLRSNNCTKKSS